MNASQNLVTVATYNLVNKFWETELREQLSSPSAPEAQKAQDLGQWMLLSKECQPLYNIQNMS